MGRTWYGIMLATVLIACDDGGTTLGNSQSTSGGGGAGTAENGLPCPVSDLIQTRCRNCHGEEPMPDALPFLAHEDLLGPSPLGFDTIAEEAVARMQDMVSGEDRMPPPPLPQASDDEVAVMQTFIDDGFPERSASEPCD